ncbi:hypothetical protein SJAV_00080 [Sulfurisphaera javensis]|uniref:Glycosyl-hydrolase family 116 catalytic region domain-containing protein n=1 Tax=Sulfurisphaera javensis TaxID=2049879 RepID=A0AAT9GMD1_9CREN
MNSVLRTHSYKGLIYSRLPAGHEYVWQIQNYLKIDENSWLFNNPWFISSIVNMESLPMSVNTFDDWTNIGISSFTSFLGIVALKLLGYDVKDLLYLYKELLWNGEYFDNWYDPVSGFRDKASNASQLLGEFYLTLLNDNLLDKETVKKVLNSIIRYNLKEGEGTINGAYPDNYRPFGREYENPLKIKASIQQDTPWSGVEFYLASHLIYEKMIDEAKKVLKEVYDRYALAGNFWNHWEWGAHYSRPLSSLLIIPAYFGIRFDGKKLSFDPVNEIEWIILLPDFWGKAIFTGKELRIQLIEGKIEVEEIEVNGKKVKEIVCDGKKVEGKIVAEKELVVTLE